MRHAGEAEAAVAVGVDRRAAGIMSGADDVPSPGLAADPALSLGARPPVFGSATVFRSARRPRADVEVDEDRAADEDRRRGGDEDAPDHGGGERAHHRPAEEVEREQRQLQRQRRHDRARQRLVGGEVDDLADRHLLVFAQDLADAVEDDDRVVQRIADDGQDRRDARQVEVDLGHREEADRQDGVVDERRHRGDAELPFEAEPDVGHDAGDGEQDRERAGPRQFAGDARADHLDAAELVVGRAERRAHLGDDLLLRRLAARLRGDADQARRWRRRCSGPARRRDRGRRPCRGWRRRRPGPLWAVHLDDRAALEVDALVDADGEEQDERQDDQRQRNRRADARPFHEGQVGVVGDEAERHGGIPRAARPSAARSAPRSETIRRVTR